VAFGPAFHSAAVRGLAAAERWGALDIPGAGVVRTQGAEGPVTPSCGATAWVIVGVRGWPIPPALHPSKPPSMPARSQLPFWPTTSEASAQRQNAPSFDASRSMPMARKP
jgi:hypothetical protein